MSSKSRKKVSCPRFSSLRLAYSFSSVQVLLMGKSGSGKTSMRAIIFKSQLAADTRRLGATIDVENSQIKFLGGLRLDLWDCGGQDCACITYVLPVIGTWTDARPPTAFMDSHLTAQSSTVFRSVHSLIYIFDAESPELLTSDTVYFLKCLRALRDQNPPPSSSTAAASSNANNNNNGSSSGSTANGSTTTSSNDEGPTVFVLLHKMDLVPVDQQASKLAEFEGEVTKKAREGGYKGAMQFYGTSIWNETLYKVRLRAARSSCVCVCNPLTCTLQAWSVVMANLMPSLSSLRTHLIHFLDLSGASEIVLFERTTFLVISSVTRAPPPKPTSGEGDGAAGIEGGEEDESKEWDERRFERISTMVKAFKLGCS